MLGQPMSMLIPQVLGFRLHGELPEGATATDLVLTVTEMLRERGVVGKFVEFYGAGLAGLPLADRATIGNMSPEFGSTCAIFPIDAETLTYLELSGRPPEQIALVEAYAKEQGLWHDEHSEKPTFSDEIELDLASVEPSLAGPKRPQDRVALSESQVVFQEALRDYIPSDGDQADAQDEAVAESYPASDPPANEPGHVELVGAAQPPQLPEGGTATALPHNGTATSVTVDGETFELDHGHVVIAAITSCTNTSNPSVMVGAGILARNALARGLEQQAVGQDLARARLEGRHRIPRPRRADRAARAARLQPRRLRLHDVHRQLRAALAGDLRRRQRGRPGRRLGALGQSQLRGPDQPGREDELPRLAAAVRRLRARRHDGRRPAARPARPRRARRGRLPARHLAVEQEIAKTVGEAVQADMFRKSYGEVFAGDERWNGLDVPEGERFAWDADSTYVRLPPYFDGMPAEPRERHRAVRRARAGEARRQRHDRPHLAGRRDQARRPGRRLPAGAGRRAARLQLLRLAPRQPRGDDARHVREHPPAQPARAGHRGRRHAPSAGADARRSVARRADVDLRRGDALRRGRRAAARARRQGVRLGLLARLGGEGHATARRARRDRAELRADPPLEPRRHGRAAAAVRRRRERRVARAERRGGLLGRRHRRCRRRGAKTATARRPSRVRAEREDGEQVEFEARLRIDTPRESEYFRHGGILQYVLRKLLAA